MSIEPWQSIPCLDTRPYADDRPENHLTLAAQFPFSQAGDGREVFSASCYCLRGPCSTMGGPIGSRPPRALRDRAPLHVHLAIQRPVDLPPYARRFAPQCVQLPSPWSRTNG